MRVNLICVATYHVAGIFVVDFADRSQSTKILMPDPRRLRLGSPSEKWAGPGCDATAKVLTVKKLTREKIYSYTVRIMEISLTLYINSKHVGCCYIGECSTLWGERERGTVHGGRIRLLPPEINRAHRMLLQSSASSLLRWSCAHWLKRVASVLSDVSLSVATYIVGGVGL